MGVKNMQITISQLGKSKTCGICGKTIANGQIALQFGQITICSMECVQTMQNDLTQWGNVLEMVTKHKNPTKTTK
jgi:hypothetical protein